MSADRHGLLRCQKFQMPSEESRLDEAASGAIHESDLMTSSCSKEKYANGIFMKCSLISQVSSHLSEDTVDAWNEDVQQTIKRIVMQVSGEIVSVDNEATIRDDASVEINYQLDMPEVRSLYHEANELAQYRPEEGQTNALPNKTNIRLADVVANDDINSVLKQLIDQIVRTNDTVEVQYQHAETSVAAIESELLQTSGKGNSSLLSENRPEFEHEEIIYEHEPPSSPLNIDLSVFETTLVNESYSTCDSSGSPIDEDEEEEEAPSQSKSASLSSSESRGPDDLDESLPLSQSFERTYEDEDSLLALLACSPVKQTEHGQSNDSLFMSPSSTPMSPEKMPSDALEMIQNINEEIKRLKNFREEAKRIVAEPKPKKFKVSDVMAMTVEEDDSIYEKGLELFTTSPKKRGRKSSPKYGELDIRSLLFTTSDIAAFALKEKMIQNVTISVAGALHSFIDILMFSNLNADCLIKYLTSLSDDQKSTHVRSPLSSDKLSSRILDVLECLPQVIVVTENDGFVVNELLILCLLLLQEDTKLRDCLWTSYLLKLVSVCCSATCVDLNSCAQIMANHGQVSMLLRVIRLMKSKRHVSLKECLIRSLLLKASVVSFDSAPLVEELALFKNKISEITERESMKFYQLYLLKEYIDLLLTSRESLSTCRDVCQILKEISSRVHPGDFWSNMVYKTTHYWSAKFGNRIALWGGEAVITRNVPFGAVRAKLEI